MVTKIKNFIFLLRNWDAVSKSMRIIQDPRGARSSAISQNLTLEEMEAVFDLERVGRILTTPSKTFKKDLTELKKSLDK